MICRVQQELLCSTVEIIHHISGRSISECVCLILDVNLSKTVGAEREILPVYESNGQYIVVFNPEKPYEYISQPQTSYYYTGKRSVPSHIVREFNAKSFGKKEHRLTENIRNFVGDSSPECYSAILALIKKSMKTDTELGIYNSFLPGNGGLLHSIAMMFFYIVNKLEFIKYVPLPDSSLLRILLRYAEPSLIKPNQIIGRKWVVEHISNWVNQSESPVLGLFDSPGSGKTAVMKQAVKLGITKYYYFCSWKSQNADLENASQFLCNIACQKYENDKEFSIAIWKRLRDFDVTDCINKKANHSDASRIRTLYSTDLKRLLFGDLFGDMTIAIDGLDEAYNQETRSNIISLLVREELYNPNSNARFILSSRYAPFEHIGAIDTINMSLDSRTKNDLTEYVTKQLSFLPATTSRDIEKIVESSGGNFAYAQKACEAIKSEIISVGFLHRGGLPNSIEELYQTWFDRIFNKAPLYHVSTSFLSILLYNDTLDQSDIQLVLGLDTQSFQDIVASLKAFFVIDATTKRISLFHKSFADWLSSNQAGQYRTTPELGERLILEFGMNALRTQTYQQASFQLNKCIYAISRHSKIAIRETVSNCLPYLLFMQYESFKHRERSLSHEMFCAIEKHRKNNAQPSAGEISVYGKSLACEAMNNFESDWGKAYELLQKARTDYQEAMSRDTSLYSTIMDNYIWVIAQKSDDKKDVLKLNDEVIKHILDAPDYPMKHTNLRDHYQERGNLLYVLGYYDDAIHYEKEALKHAKLSGDNPSLSIQFHSLGFAFLQKEFFATSEKYFLLSVHERKRLYGETYNTALGYDALCRLYLDRARKENKAVPPECRKYNKLTERIVKPLNYGTQPLYARCLLTEAFIMEYEGERGGVKKQQSFERAKRLAENAQKIYKMQGEYYSSSIRKCQEFIGKMDERLKAE